ncbi:bifunctional 2-C-methyl-D-erythritol 4-phosphate cytidylyltransferase/2-C-methyl-D-erythritol 2,4-cyclodiphosphate synthase [Parerythrobacter jejuensis]|uniref:Bifunctional enzyme IspD/IspF n=1 Tax=Parerythrobacter jejuensis TaxID=795812 RepID=A0A845ANK7_9SPHN|nr:bifunctional 2-C-methyl-D-erythritol 4-phosphate cytidylyltransferase/2-C-methyl-D-erythritol 2,4-cyclodiphosphate synthase [Parerythrobacter jejuensis]MXP32392.1 bifunctional 2-C-methyl-D-erythritol 4-phosphate cytidylyltransferase/2-C-methyl-D-erythritol 2,4-cyclodiphosphate synthase [Parerythrobacter jejuensis]
MTETGPLPPFCVVIVAAGKGMRAGQPVPKQFAMWRGKPVLRHSAEALLNAGASSIVVAIPAGGDAAAQEALRGLEECQLVTGGASRQHSVRLALEALEQDSPARVLIHDAARPILPREVIARVLTALDTHTGAIPVLPVVDSLARETDGVMSGAADRSALRRVQTPQGFRFNEILAAHRAWVGDATAGDDAQVLQSHAGSIAMVPGDEALKKLTYAEDFMGNLPPMRVGTGYDVHKLAMGEELWLGGIRIEHDKGLAGHSDADVALHAIIDALLGAIGNGDIGSHFPPSDDRWKGAASSAFLEHAVSLVASAGYRVGNIDLTIICEAPKIGPHREAMRATIAALCSCNIDQISVKATTTERLGFTGRGEGIAAQAVATVMREA